MTASFHITTLGCKVNQYESQALKEAWLGLGYTESPDPSGADFVLINSCAITARAVADTRAAVRAAHKAAPGAKIIVTGCATQVQADELGVLPGVCRVVLQSDKKALLAGPLPIGGEAARPGFFHINTYARSRAVLKVQDGCSHGCSYCIVPLARGAARSRPVDECLGEAGRLLKAGFREIVISGINLRQYEHEGSDFWDLVRLLETDLAPEWAGRARFRISSLEPGQLHERALEVLARSRLIAPHLHISMQSGSREVLGRMNRGHYEPGQLAVFLKGLAEVWPVFGLGADFIAGFPGETEAEHAETADMLGALPFTYAHIFPFSSRPGARAAKLPDQIEHGVKKRRAAELRAVARVKKENFLRAMLRVPEQVVIFEDRQGSELLGVNQYYVDCRAAPRPDIAARELVRVRPLTIEKDRLQVEKA